MDNVLNLINYNIDLKIDNLRNSLDTNQTNTYITNPTIALLTMLKGYLDHHRDLLKPLLSIYQTTNDNSFLKQSIKIIINSMTDEIQHKLQQSYYHHANLDINLKDLIILYVNKVI